MKALSIGSHVMPRLPLLLVVAVSTGAACGETVPLNHDGAGGSASAGAGGDDDAAGQGVGATSSGTSGAHSPTGGVDGTGGASTAGTGPNTAGTGATANAGASGDAGNATAGDNPGGSGGSGVVPPAVCETSPSGPVSGGSRLKALCVRSAADGSQILRRGKLFDSELGEECSYRAAADGSWRCLPTLHVNANITATFGFADASCTQRVTWLDKPIAGCTVNLPKYVYQLEPAPVCGYQDGRDHRTHVFPIGELIAQPVPLYSKAGGTCSPVVAPNDRVWYALGAELPAFDFVLGTQTIAP